jgi:ribosomal protein S18 acetylase RimI-like enzyme
MSQVRVLEAGDAADFRTVRLRALREHPEAFGSAYEEEVSVPVEQTAEWLANSLPNNPIFGAYMDGRLVGLININRSPRAKVRHRANIGAMYVAPEARGHGFGRALLDAAIAHARSLDGVQDVVLAVTAGNEAARALYTSAGFQSYSIDPRLICVDGQYYDVEWMILGL